MILVLLWLWSNEDLLNLGFREFLMIELELEASISSCVVDISQSILLPATHTISPMYWSCAPISALLNRCVWTLRYAHHQQLACPPLNQELNLWNNLHYLLNHLDCWNFASYHRHSNLRTNYKQVGLISALCPARLSFTLERDNSG